MYQFEEFLISFLSIETQDRNAIVDVQTKGFNSIVNDDDIF